MKLTKVEQRRLLRALPSSRVATVQRVCRQCEQQGDGVKDILKKARDALGPVAQEVGPVVMKEFIFPMLLKKMGVSGEGKKRKR